MKAMLPLLLRNRLYFLVLCSILFACTCMVILFGEHAVFIPLGQHHPVWLNVFFINYTFIGDGCFALILPAFFLFYLRERQTGLLLLFAFLFSETAVQAIKNLFNNANFNLYFEKGQYLFFTDEADLFNTYSFPSGHTAIAFAIAAVCIIRIRNKNWQLPVLAAAIVLAVSRMYLAQDSILEVVAGAFTGSASGLLAYYCIQNAGMIKYFFRELQTNRKKSVEPRTVQHAI